MGVNRKRILGAMDVFSQLGPSFIYAYDVVVPLLHLADG